MSRYRDEYNALDSQRSNSRIQHAAESSRTRDQTDNRYSWVDTVPEEQSILRTPASLRPPTTNIPPLPAIPEHLSHEFQMRQNADRGRPQTQSQAQTQDQTGSHAQHRQPSHRQDLSKQQEAALYQRSSNQLASLPLYSFEPLDEHQQLLPEEDQGQEEDEHMVGIQRESHVQRQSRSVGQTFEPSINSQTTLRDPEPDSESETEHKSTNTRKPVHCEDNPLIPVSPSDIHYNSTRSLASITSPDPSIYPPTPKNFHFARYTPAPQPVHGGTWSRSLCSCVEPSICLTGLFCPCILYGRTQHRLHLRTDKRRDATNMLGHKTFNGACLTWALFCSCGVGGILAGFQRSRLRRAYTMDPEAGSVPRDCLLGCCCCCCVLAQSEKEVVYREERGKMDLDATTRVGYVSPTGMNFGLPPR